MADKIVRVWAPDNTPIDLVMVDLGGGLYAIKTSDGGGGGAGDASAANQVIGNASLAAIDAGIPAALGPAAAANAMPVVLSTDGPFATNFGVIGDTEATTDTGSFSFLSFVKRLLNTKLKIGQQTKAASLAVAPASDYQQPILPTNASPAWTNITANGADGVAAMDVSNYRMLTLQLSGTWVGTVNVELSINGTNWVATRGWSSGAGPILSNLTANNMYVFPLPAGVQMRIRTVAFTSGPIVGTVALSSLAATPFELSSTTIANTSGTTTTVRSPSDGIGAGTPNGLDSMAYGMIYNASTTGASFDRERSNSAMTVLASAARAATVSTDVITYNATTFRVILNITAAPNTASTLTVAIRVKDSISGNYVTILTAAAVTGSVITGTVPNTTSLATGAGLVATANVSAPEALARTMNVLVTHSNGDSWTYSVSVELGV